MKICKTCRFWSMDKKGFCRHQNQGVGQFYSCADWSAGDPGPAAEDSCRICPTRAPR